MHLPHLEDVSIERKRTTNRSIVQLVYNQVNWYIEWQGNSSENLDESRVQPSLVHPLACQGRGSDNKRESTCQECEAIAMEKNGCRNNWMAVWVFVVDTHSLRIFWQWPNLHTFGNTLIARRRLARDGRSKLLIVLVFAIHNLKNKSCPHIFSDTVGTTSSPAVTVVLCLKSSWINCLPNVLSAGALSC